MLFKTTIIILITHSLFIHCRNDSPAPGVTHVPECDSDQKRLRRRAVTVRTASLEMLNIGGAVSRAGP